MNGGFCFNVVLCCVLLLSSSAQVQGAYRYFYIGTFDFESIFLAHFSNWLGFVLPLALLESEYL